MSDKWQIIGLGRVGWHAKGGNVSSSSYDNTEQGLQSYVKNAAEGAWVYDASKVDLDTFSEFIIHGPMVDLRLDPQAYSKFSDYGAVKRMTPGLQGSFKVLAKMAADDKWSGFDSVGVDLYIELLKAKVPGVRIGKVVNGQVEWEGNTNLPGI